MRASPGLFAFATALAALAALLTRRWGVVAVAGNSMRPTLRPGDACLVRYGAPIRSGDVVVARL
ncbi:MAG: Peptidase S24-like, partial [Frankiaceae bacterium]|nr:Peptidase S24-like [Frankiaceae bacterium]